MVRATTNSLETHFSTTAVTHSAKFFGEEREGVELLVGWELNRLRMGAMTFCRMTISKKTYQNDTY